MYLREQEEIMGRFKDTIGKSSIVGKERGQSTTKVIENQTLRPVVLSNAAITESV